MNWKIGLLLAISAIAYFTFLVLGIKESNTCNRHVKFMDSTELDCRRAQSYDDGTTHIVNCKGDLVIVPTIRIKEITKK